MPEHKKERNVTAPNEEPEGLLALLVEGFLAARARVLEKRRAAAVRPGVPAEIESPRGP
jgi:hypothetical protein